MAFAAAAALLAMGAFAAWQLATPGAPPPSPSTPAAPVQETTPKPVAEAPSPVESLEQGNVISSSEAEPVRDEPRAAAPPAAVRPSRSSAPAHADRVPHATAEEDVPTDADDLLQRANTLRGEGRWREAARTYERVIALTPKSSKGYVARAAAASLRLEHLGDPRGALSLYRAALAEHPNGGLSEEIRWGIAECHRALGERAEEAAALRAFLQAHPESVTAARAKARLASLSEE